MVPPHNDVDVFSQDLGFIAILDTEGLEEGRLLGFNLVVGGGLGATHGEPQTYPRIADVIGFLTPEQMLKVAETVVMIQRDFGDRTERKHARLKYTIADRGIDWFKGELFKRLGFELEPRAPLQVHHAGRPLRLAARSRRPLAPDAAHRVRPRRRPSRRACILTGLEKIAQIHQGDFRLTPNQNLIIANVPPERVHEDRPDRGGSRAREERCSPAPCGAMRWPAWRCPPAVWPWPRPSATCRVSRSRSKSVLAKHGLKEHPAHLRITGCPNGCARPYLAEIALIGRAPGRYTLRLGADAVGQRLNVIYRDNIDENAILAALDELFARYAAERQTDERFGDFLWRVQLLTPEKRS